MPVVRDPEYRNPQLQLYDEDEDWLPKNFKPMTWQQFVWYKIKSAPLVGVGICGVLGSFGMASYQYRLGNSARFNYWLRWRVGMQFFTVASLVYYGGAAFTRERQNEIFMKQRVLLGDLPANTPIPRANNNPFADKPDASSWRSAVLPGSEDGAEIVEEEEIVDDPELAQHYPRPIEERMTPADFRAKLQERQALGGRSGAGAGAGSAGVGNEGGEGRGFEARLRRAVRDQGIEDDLRARGELQGVQSVTGPGELLRRRAKELAAKKESREKKGAETAGEESTAR